MLIFVFCRLFADLVNDSLTEFAYDADLAGLSYAFESHDLGIFVTLNGYNDKLYVLARAVLKKVKNLVVDPKRLEVMKEQVILYFNSQMDDLSWLLFADATELS